MFAFVITLCLSNVIYSTLITTGDEFQPIIIVFVSKNDYAIDTKCLLVTEKEQMGNINLHTKISQNCPLNQLTFQHLMNGMTSLRFLL